MAPPAKRRKTQAAIQEITFDPEARQDFLTGFHKRKLQRTKHAQEQAAKKDREQRIEDRKQMREQRKKDVENHVQAVNEMLRKAAHADVEDDTHEQSEEEDGEVDTEGERFMEANIVTAHEDEYVDEDRYTTVTVQAMNMSGNEEEESMDGAESGTETPGLNVPNDSSEKETNVAKEETGKGRVWTKEKPATAKLKKKKKKFRYETKVERKATRAKQKTRNNAAAKARRSTD